MPREERQRGLRLIASLPRAREREGREHGFGDVLSRVAIQRGVCGAARRRRARVPVVLLALVVLLLLRGGGSSSERGERGAHRVESLRDEKVRPFALPQRAETDAEEPLRRRRLFHVPRRRRLLHLRGVSLHGQRPGLRQRVVQRRDRLELVRFHLVRVPSSFFVIFAEQTRDVPRLRARQRRQAELEQRDERHERRGFDALLRPELSSERPHARALDLFRVRLRGRGAYPRDVRRDELQELASSRVHLRGRFSNLAHELEVVQRAGRLRVEEHRGRGGELVGGEAVQDLADVVHDVRGFVVVQRRALGLAVQALEQVLDLG